MLIEIRRLALTALVLTVSCAPVFAQAGISGGLGLLAVQAQVTSDPEPAAPAPTTAEALEAVDRILELWPELVGTLPEGDPRYNVADIGHVAQSTKVGFAVKSIMISKMVAGMRKCGITVPEKPLQGDPRPVDVDRNGEKARKVTRAQLEELQEDTDTVRAYFDTVMAKFGQKSPVNADGLSVTDWKRIRTTLKGMSLIVK